MTQTIAIIAPSSVPFIIGGAEKFWQGLHKGLSEHSDSYVELIKVPCRELTFAEIVSSYNMFSELDLSHFDMVISSKYPAWMIKHPKHVVYMQHTLRGLYDTYHFTHLPETLTDVPDSLRDLVSLIRKAHPNREDLAQVFELLQQVQSHKNLPSALFAFPGPLIREVVHFFDRVALAPEQVAAYASISETVRMRKDYLPEGVDVKILHHPSDIIAFANAPGAYIFTASRLTNMKRVDMIVEAMRYVSVDIPLKIAGTGSELERLKALAGDDPRIEFLGYVPDAQLPELYSRALFVPFVPYDEDYGLITIEAMRSGKPVVTTTDAGGVCEFVRNGETGYCVEPDPVALGAAMQQLAADPEQTREMGRNAQALVADITWDKTTATLLEHCATSMVKKAAKGRKTILVASTFSVAQPVSGGQKRIYHLCRELARTYFVVLVCSSGGEEGRTNLTELADCFHEIRLPESPERCRVEAQLTEQTGASVGDIACMDTCAQDETLLATLRQHGENAAFVIASHPYLYPALKQALPEKTLIYDAHNVEFDMKTVVLGDCEGASAILARVAEVERDCCRTATRMLTCSCADAQRFAELYNIEKHTTVLVPNGYDAASVNFATRNTRQKLRKRLEYADVPLALFMGSWHRPNLEAVERIKEIAEELSDVQFLVAGSVGEAPGMCDAAPDNVHFLGVLLEEEKNVLLHAAHVGLNPVSSGSGTNLKSIEYLASGLETVSTTFGLRGLDGSDGSTNALVAVHACELETFAANIREILEHPLSNEKLALTARYVEERFSWTAVMAPLRDVLPTLCLHVPTENE